MNEVVVTSIEGRTLHIDEPRHRDADGIWSFTATLTTECGTAATEVWDSGDALSALFRDLADALGGFEGEREYASLEGQLSLRCTHDGRGTVSCAVTLARPAPPKWSFSAHLDLGAGAHLERIASEFEAFVTPRS